MPESPLESPSPRWLRTLLPAAMAMAFVVGALYFFRGVLGPFIFAVVLVYVMEPVVQRLNFHGTFGFHWPRWLAIVSLYLVLLSAIVAFGFLAIPTLTTEMSRLAREVPGILQDVRKELVQGVRRVETYLDEEQGIVTSVEPDALALEGVGDMTPPPLATPAPAFTVRTLPDGRLAVYLGNVDIRAEETSSGYAIALVPPEAQEGRGKGLDLTGMVDARFDELVRSSGAYIGEAILLARRLAEGIFGSIISVVLTFMIAAFISIDLGGVLTYFRRLVPASVQQTGDLLLTKLDRRLSGVIRGQLIICLVNGVLTYIILAILGMRFVFLLSIVATAFTLIPIFGMIISAVPAIAIALMDGGFNQALLVVIGILFIHFLEANFFNPKIIGSSAKIHPVLIIFALLAGEHYFGLLGALLAAPTMAIMVTLVQFALEQALREPRGESPAEPPGVAEPEAAPTPLPEAAAPALAEGGGGPVAESS